MAINRIRKYVISVLNRSPTPHTHTSGEIADFQLAVSSNTDVATMKAIVGNGISDGDTVVDTLAEMLSVFSNYSEGVDIAIQLAGKAPAVHAHSQSEIIGLAADLLTVNALISAKLNQNSNIFLDADKFLMVGDFKSPRVIYCSAISASHTNSTVETTVRTVAIPTLGENTAIRIHIVSSANNNVNAKTIRIKLNGTAFSAVSLAGTARILKYSLYTIEVLLIHK